MSCLFVEVGMFVSSWFEQIRTPPCYSHLQWSTEGALGGLLGIVYHSVDWFSAVALYFVLRSSQTAVGFSIHPEAKWSTTPGWRKWHPWRRDSIHLHSVASRTKEHTQPYRPAWKCQGRLQNMKTMTCFEPT